MTHKIFLDFEIQTNHQIPTKRPDVELTRRKRIRHLGNFTIPVDRQVKVKESKKKIDKFLHEDDSNTNCSWHAKNGS